MKSKYFNITDHPDGTADIFTVCGKNIAQNVTYEINPKQPQYIKVCHDKAWRTLFDCKGRAAKDTLYVHDVRINDDGSYDVKEYCNTKHWTHYDNGASIRQCFANIFSILGQKRMCHIMCLEKWIAIMTAFILSSNAMLDRRDFVVFKCSHKEIARRDEERMRF